MPSQESPSSAIPLCACIRIAEILEETGFPAGTINVVTNAPAEEAMTKALDTRYGLSAAIVTADRERGLEMAQRFDCSMFHVNGATMAGEPSLPNGGAKDSGWGGSGHYAIEDFTEIRLTTMTRGHGRYPF